MFRNQLGVMGKNLRKSRKKNRQSLFSSTWGISKIRLRTMNLFYREQVTTNLSVAQ